jgi:hypothetical protein
VTRFDSWINQHDIGIVGSADQLRMFIHRQAGTPVQAAQNAQFKVVSMVHCLSSYSSPGICNAIGGLCK